MSTRIVIGDERRLFSEAIAETLRHLHDFDVVEIVNDSREIVPAVVRLLPAVAVLGSVSSSGDGLSLADELRAVAPQCGIAVIGTDPGRGTMEKVPSNGVFSVVPDNAGLTHLVRAIKGLVSDCAGIDQTVIRQPSPARQSLSDREREVLRLTADGAPVREIAAELFLSPGTVRNLTSSAIKKLGGRNRFDAACIASKRGWL
ncbi:two component transcriptional regulator, LuxR family [Streptomyces sp. WMMB 714]|jgi:two-component system response regulator DesR|nr:two component transcriptional regulator, LuxR family [Streptomyces sp. WMMB 714]